MRSIYQKNHTRNHIGQKIQSTRLRQKKQLHMPRMWICIILLRHKNTISSRRSISRVDYASVCVVPARSSKHLRSRTLIIPHTNTQWHKESRSAGPKRMEVVRGVPWEPFALHHRHSPFAPDRTTSELVRSPGADLEASGLVACRPVTGRASRQSAPRVPQVRVRRQNLPADSLAVTTPSHPSYGHQWSHGQLLTDGPERTGRSGRPLDGSSTGV
jgi:hypothetical protein